MLLSVEQLTGLQLALSCIFFSVRGRTFSLFRISTIDSAEMFIEFIQHNTS